MGGSIPVTQNIENFKNYVSTFYSCGEVSCELSTGVKCLKTESGRRSGGKRRRVSTGGADSVLSTLSTGPTTITIPYKYLYTTWIS